MDPCSGWNANHNVKSTNWVIKWRVVRQYYARKCYLHAQYCLNVTSWISHILVQYSAIHKRSTKTLRRNRNTNIIDNIFLKYFLLSEFSRRNESTWPTSCNAVLAWIPGYMYLQLRLQPELNAAALLIYSAKKYDHITPLLRELHWLRVPERIQFWLCVLAYRCLTGKAP